jgi:hypothetical protein
VKQGVWADGLKATSQDGYTFSFYKKKKWNLISSNMFFMVKEFFWTNRLPKGISSFFVTLIPKTRGLDRFS